MPRPNWVDNPSIPDDAVLWRGIVPIQIKPGAAHPSQGAFETEEVSVNISHETTAAALLAKGQRYGSNWRLWAFTAGEARSYGCIVDRDPEEGDSSHAVVLRSDSPGRKRLRGSQAKKLAENGRWADEQAE